MSIYESKARWKLILAIVAMLIVGATLVYTNILARKISAEEKEKVSLWVQAIQKKGALVDYTRKLFTELEVEERKRMELWAKAQQEVYNPKDDYATFFLDIVTANTTIPIIITDEDSVVQFSKNIIAKEITEFDTLIGEKRRRFTDKEPFEMTIPLLDNAKQYIFYTDSRIVTELRTNLNDIINSFITEDIIQSATVPVIYASSQDSVIAYGNIDSLKMATPASVKQEINKMKKANTPLEVNIDNDKKSYVYYRESAFLRQLKWFPVIQLAAIGLFLLIAYLTFSNERKSEQNRVWVGMAKETAHQLGTPISSLVAWLELLKASPEKTERDLQAISEIEKDVSRLHMISDRFSKIGSAPKLTENNLKNALEDTFNYMRKRSSKKSKLVFDYASNVSEIGHFNPLLFNWVVENLIKNGLDAMQGEGEMTLKTTEKTNEFLIDISDNGKGIPKNKFKTVFEPGFSTKKRGWGLGLALCKRIIEQYHNGKIFVLKSTLGEGTTFRIQLPKKRG